MVIHLLPITYRMAQRVSNAEIQKSLTRRLIQDIVVTLTLRFKSITFSVHHPFLLLCVYRLSGLDLNTQSFGYTGHKHSHLVIRYLNTESVGCTRLRNTVCRLYRLRHTVRQLDRAYSHSPSVIQNLD